METLFLLNWLFLDAAPKGNCDGGVVIAILILFLCSFGIVICFVFAILQLVYESSASSNTESSWTYQIIDFNGIREIIQQRYSFFGNGQNAERARNEEERRRREQAEREQAQATRKRIEEERLKQEAIAYKRCEECVSNFWDDFQNSDETTRVLLSRLKFVLSASGYSKWKKEFYND